MKTTASMEPPESGAKSIVPHVSPIATGEASGRGLAIAGGVTGVTSVIGGVVALRRR